jgi:hypothetical protein
MIQDGTQQDELTDRNPRNCYKLAWASCRIEHPVGDLKGTAVRLPDQEVVNTIMLVVTRHQDRLADQRMEGVSDRCLECQKPGTMAPARTVVPGTGPSP